MLAEIRRVAALAAPTLFGLLGDRVGVHQYGQAHHEQRIGKQTESDGEGHASRQYGPQLGHGTAAPEPRRNGCDAVGDACQDDQQRDVDCVADADGCKMNPATPSFECSNAVAQLKASGPPYKSLPLLARGGASQTGIATS